jgi:GcrA cell cycle regulator
MLASQPTWTTERIELLKSSFDAGLTCREIAGRIGVSRNAVIGKLSRLQLKRERLLPAPRRKDITRNPRRTVRLRMRRQFLMSIEIEEAPIHTAHTCSLFELSAETCRWPISTPGAEDFCFCGSPPMQGFPYCPGHSRLAYRVSSR